MSASKIKLLKKRIEKLEDKDFDLEAWKASTTTVISRVFGQDDPAIKDINNLTIDYSSWALRDATSTYNPKETCKKKGKEILEALIDELEINEETPDLKAILKEELSKELNKKLKNVDDPEEKAKILKNEKKDVLINILLKILD